MKWVRPWLSITTEDLPPLFNLLKEGEELSSPRTLTQEAKLALEKVQAMLTSRQAHWCLLDLPFKFIVLGRLPHLHGMIFQWDEGTRKDKDQRDPILIVEWVFLSHYRTKTLTKPQELVVQLIRKARARIRELAGCNFACIHLLIKLSTGLLTKEALELLLQENEALQFALDSYTGQIWIHSPARKFFNVELKLVLKENQSQKPLEALTVFTDVSGASHKSVVTWRYPDSAVGG